MARPKILADSATGTDNVSAANCSGAGPGTALTVTDATTDAVDGTTVTLPNMDLTNVLTDGTHAVYLHTTTSGNRRWSRITAKANSGTATAQVTVANAYALSLGPIGAAIGGKLATFSSASSALLINQPAAAQGDAMGGWIMEMASGHTETSAAQLTFDRQGSSTDGPIILRGAPGAATRPVMTFSNNGTSIALNQNGLQIHNFDMKNSSATKGSTLAINIGSAINHVVVKGIRVDDQTNYYQNGISVNGAGAIVRDSSLGYCASSGITIVNVSTATIINCQIHHCTSHGIVYNGTSQPTGARISGNTIWANTGDGISCTYSGTSNKPSEIFENVINGNSSDGIQFTATAITDCAYTSTCIESNHITNNASGYALNFSGGAAITNLALESVCFQIRCNNNYGNIALSNLTLTIDEGTRGLDPGYTDSANGNFSQGVNCKALGYPNGLTLAVGTYSITYNYVDIGIQRIEVGVYPTRVVVGRTAELPSFIFTSYTHTTANRTAAPVVVAATPIQAITVQQNIPFSYISHGSTTISSGITPVPFVRPPLLLSPVFITPNEFPFPGISSSYSNGTALLNVPSNRLVRGSTPPPDISQIEGIAYWVTNRTVTFTKPPLSVSARQSVPPSYPFAGRSFSYSNATALLNVPSTRFVLGKTILPDLSQIEGIATWTVPSIPPNTPIYVVYGGETVPTDFPSSGSALSKTGVLPVPFVKPPLPVPPRPVVETVPIPFPSNGYIVSSSGVIPVALVRPPLPWSPIRQRVPDHFPEPGSTQARKVQADIGYSLPYFGGTTGNTAVASLTLYPPVPITGKTIVVAVSMFRGAGAPTCTVTDSANNPYTQIGTYQPSASVQEAMGLFYAHNISPPTWIKITPNNPSTINAGVHEFQKDYLHVYTQSANGSSAVPDCGLLQVYGRYNLLFSIMRFGAASLLTATPGEIHTETDYDTGYIDSNGVNNFSLCCEYKEGVLPPAQGSWTLSESTSWSCIGASFRPVYLQAPGSAPVPFPVPAPTQSIRLQSGIWLLNPISPPLFLGQAPNALSLANPNCDGIVLRQMWKELQPTPGVGGFDWTYLDGAIATVLAAHRAVKLDLLVGIYCPDWVYEYGAESFNFIPGYFGFLPDNTVHSMPVPWDPGFQALLTVLAREVATRYALDGSVVAITYGGFCSLTGESYFPAHVAIDHPSDTVGTSITNPTGHSIPYTWDTTNDLINWQARGYTRTKMYDAFIDIQNIWDHYFPNCMRSYQMHSQAFPPIDQNGVRIVPTSLKFDFEIVQMIADRIVASGSPVAMQNDGWTLGFISSYVAAADALGVRTGYQELRNESPSMSAANFQTMINQALAAGAEFLEFYRFDLNFADYQAILGALHVSFSPRPFQFVTDLYTPVVNIRGKAGG